MVKAQKDDSTEEKIFAAAKKVFMARGMAGARMQEIADEAGINKALVHYYFRSKEQLFEKIFERLTEGFWEQVTSVFESDEPLFDKIRNFCALYIEKVIQNPYIPLFVLYEMSQRPDALTKVFRDNPPNPTKLIKQIEAEVKAGNIRPIAPPQLFMNMISMCVLPFIGKPMFKSVMNINDEAFLHLMQQRKTEVPEFIINSIKK